MNLLIERNCFITAFDNITEGRQAEAAQEATIELLRLCNGAAGLTELMQELTSYFQQVTGCEAVGVRLREGDDFPYYETRGFPENFVLAESRLCAKDGNGNVVCDSNSRPLLECMCGNILRGRFDPSKSFFTAHGSFWTNSTTELLATTTEADRQAKTRNRCNGEGYESAALVPLRAHGEAFGLFQFNDRRKGRFTSQKIALLEDLIDYVAIALAKLKADEELRESERKFRELYGQFHDILNTIPDRITIQAPDLRVLWANRSAAVAGLNKGRSTLMGGFCYSVWHDRTSPCDPCPVVRSFRTGEPDLEIVATPDGKIWELRTLPVKEANGVVNVIEVARDITEHRRLEEQLRQAQKMEAVGQLAGGIAHDFNNILSTVVGYAHLMHDKLRNDGPLKAYAAEILAASEGATQVTHSLLAFSRKQVVNLKPVNLNMIIVKTEQLLRRVIGEDIEFRTMLTLGGLDVVADSGQIEQVLMNLATNARDAMPGGGKLTISSDMVEMGDDFIRANGYGKRGLYAVVAVTDTGCGMDEKTRQNIFEPFFTTKEQGKGTGLGLAMVYGIMKQHGGYINVCSGPGKGTTFRLYFPSNKSKSIIRDDTEQNDFTELKGGKETILVAEDDPALRKLSTVVLTGFGYGVITAENGEDAVLKFEEHKDDIGLVILDMIMPKKSGKEAYEEIVRMRPGVKVIFVSGYTADKVRSEELIGGVEFLLKPISPKDLLRKVRSVLDDIPRNVFDKG